MSRILDKPFSWTKKIINAVFKGAPNLITTSDLNRQIVALKKEMYSLQQSMGVVVSDLAVVSNPSSSLFYTNGSYVLCGGVKFELNLQGQYFVNRRGELRLYATKELITDNDDVTKEISGAKFEDATTLPAADHYVYKDAEVVYVDLGAPTPLNLGTLPQGNLDALAPADDVDSDFNYTERNGKEYVCTLLRAERKYMVDEEGDDYGRDYPSPLYIQKFTVPMGKGIVDLKRKNGTFRVFDIATAENTYEGLVPNADDDWKDSVHKLWSRLYSLEKRLFMETSYGWGDSQVWVNGHSHTIEREHTYEGTDSVYGDVSMLYEHRIIGNICFIYGVVDFEKNISAEGLEDILQITLEGVPGAKNNGFPPLLIVQNTTYNQPQGKMSTISGYINDDTISFTGIPQGGAEVSWNAVYVIDSSDFWGISKDDIFGYLHE